MVETFPHCGRKGFVIMKNCPEWARGLGWPAPHYELAGPDCDPSWVRLVRTWLPFPAAWGALGGGSSWAVPLDRAGRTGD
jgi:hypothetical protein